jgi:hypothetical protein
LARWIICPFSDCSIQVGNGEATQAWALIGSLTRTVEYLQLTVEQEDTERHALSRPFVSLSPTRGWVEVEERRRVFWNVFNLDRFCSVTMGWNTSLTSDDVHRRLPCDGILWRKQDEVATPYFGIWDKAAGRIGNPIAFAPEHYAPTPQVPEEELQSPSSTVTSPEVVTTAAIDMSTVGAFAYSIEATESLSRITSYFLQQKVNMRDPREVGKWLTRYKELDLRLVHWKMLLPQKWKATMARQSTRMDPNLTLAHVTHNASMILLHQLIAFPLAEWSFRARLPSAWSAETCQSATVEIATITENYLKNAPASLPVASQFAFCIYVAARSLLVRWRYYEETNLVPEFWSLVQSLEEMSRRWAGNTDSDPIINNLAGKYANQLSRLHRRCQDDKDYRIDVMDFTTEVDHSPHDKIEVGNTDLLSQDLPTSQMNAVRLGNTAPANEPSATSLNHKGPLEENASHHAQNLTRSAITDIPIGSTNLPPNEEFNPQAVGGRAGQPYSAQVIGANELSAISRILLDQQFMDMDRVISYDDGLFGSEFDGGGW